MDSNISRLMGISVILLVSCALSTVFTASSNRSCEIKTKCSDAPPLVYAKDSRDCWVFANECQFNNYNCLRKQEYERPLVVTTKEECDNTCSRGCSKELNLVCTSQNGTSKTFANPCVWHEEICQTGTQYLFSFKGSCGPDT